MTQARIAVLASGGGSNLQALLDHLRTLGASCPAQVVLIASDTSSALALERGRRAGIATVVMDRDQRGDGMRALLQSHQCTHVVLAGYLKLVPPDVCRAFRGRIVNVHPALLPAFGGSGMFGPHVHEAVLRSGARVSGATVHFVDDAYDRGPIIAQWPVPVFGEDTAETVAIRVLEVEHQLLPRVVVALVTGAIALDADGRVRTRHDRITWNHFVASDASGVADVWAPATT